MKRKRAIWITIFLLPTIILFVCVFAVPLVTVIATSLTDWKMLSEPIFIGIGNYIDLFTNDPDFGVAIRNTLVWALLQSTIHVGFGIMVALILSRKRRGWKFVRTVYMIPNIISTAALGILFLNLFQPEMGLINGIIRALGFTDFNKNWFFEKSSAFATIASVQLFYAATITILVMSEIFSISEEIYDSAKIDGATEFQIDMKIKLPLVKNIIGTSTIIAASSIISSFDFVYMITKGGPGNATMTLSLLLYNNAMRNYDFGRANAIGMIQLLVGIVFIGVITRIFRIGKSDEEVRRKR